MSIKDAFTWKNIRLALICIALIVAAALIEYFCIYEQGDYDPTDRGTAIIYKSILASAPIQGEFEEEDYNYLYDYLYELADTTQVNNVHFALSDDKNKITSDISINVDATEEQINNDSYKVINMLVERFPEVETVHLYVNYNKYEPIGEIIAYNGVVGDFVKE